MPFSFANYFLRSVPPWLQATNGAKIVLGIGDVLDAAITRSSDAVKARFPVDDPDPTGLALLGAERRIRRGPGEAATTYARRLRPWWDAHRLRGGPYELLRQMRAFLRDRYNVRIDVVAQSGNRHWIDPATDVITHDPITWGGNGDLDGDPVLLAGNALPGAMELRPVTLSSFPNLELTLRLDDGSGHTEIVHASGTSTSPYPRIVLTTPVVGTYLAGPSTVSVVGGKWAHLWVFVYVDTILDPVVTSANEHVVTELGDRLIVTALFSGTLPDGEAEVFRAIPREWKAGHIPYVTVVLLYGTARLWGYPPGSTWGEPGRVWQTSDPVILIAE